MEPRWKRCVKATDENLGMALASSTSTAPSALKARTHTEDGPGIETAMREDIGQLTWMSDTTKKKAYEKLNTIVNNIGYPDTWRDYSSVLIKSTTMPAIRCARARSKCTGSIRRSISPPIARNGNDPRR